ncbi:cysteine synthase A [Chryseolinea serpens]|uniref:N-(2-amino-2-carboxyethyl)-L-glutamate synthase n=1 Tax=Chryseolinea serpens TaxID=947013 RepID=A0A1M5XVW8_9BACT|nr:2,3-diaminopropionate biosynthesis protein SbnA [Chryseolinea serpens]SHI03403.1 cysteine synthase A [Chryseolinea serpens]
MIFNSVLDLVGETPVVHLPMPELDNINVFAKLEYANPTGSIKDRAAAYILRNILKDQTINRETTIIESSSGNFGIALSSVCRSLGLKFICVIDPCISPANEFLIRSFGATVVKVQQEDEYGGYLLTRLEKVRELQSTIPNSYWVNQYGNPLNARTYYESLGQEIHREFETLGLDYIFLGVSSGGTIAGLSRKLKEKFPNIAVVAVDVEGSVIFGNKPKKRRIPGIGSSMVPSILKYAQIDDVVIVNEQETVSACREMLSDNFIFAGGSSGSVYAGMRKYFATHRALYTCNALCILPDRGERYLHTIYNDHWGIEISERRVAEPAGEKDTHL